MEWRVQAEWDGTVVDSRGADCFGRKRAERTGRQSIGEDRRVGERRAQKSPDEGA